MAPRAAPRPLKRKGFWYLVKRVPERVRSIESRALIFVSTGIRITDDPLGVSARERVHILANDLEQDWSDKLAGRNPDDRRNLTNAATLARAHNLNYAPADIVATLPGNEFYQRLEIAAKDSSPETVNAVLGGVRFPSLKVSDLPSEYQVIHAATFARKSPNQQRKWRVARDTNVNQFIEVIGSDPALTDLTTAHSRKYRDYLSDLAAHKEITIETANKYLGRIAGMCRAVSDYHNFNLPDVFSKCHIPGAVQNQRVAFEPEFVQTQLLRDGALEGLNTQARAIVYVMVETGLRIAEICALNENTIHLGAKVPYISIQDDDRQVKSRNALRDMPVVGVALMALQKFPNGFERYNDKNDVLSASVNSYLSDHFTLKPKQTLYSLRHTFEDRLTAVETPEKITARLMGHRWHREKYGSGPTLEHLQEWLNKIAFVPPSFF